jgi:hypothetical protein
VTKKKEIFMISMVKKAFKEEVVWVELIYFLRCLVVEVADSKVLKKVNLFNTQLKLL